MKIPFLDLKANYNSIKDEIAKAIQEVLDNTAYVLGKSVFEFEKDFAQMHNTKYCIGVSSGTDGNHVVLWALDIGPGDEVIIPANTFIATAWGATLNGAKPVFVDCHPESYNIDPSKLETVITEKTKAIVAVHLYGQPADIDEIKNVLDKLQFIEKSKGVFIHNNRKQTIYIVEDAAQAHLAEYKGKKIGGLGVASSFSFYPGKNLGAYGEAGAVMTNNEELAQKFKMIRDHGADQKYNHIMFGHNYRMSGIQGAVLGVKLKYLPEWTESRRRVAVKYCKLLGDIEEIKLPIEMNYAKHVYHLFVIQVKNGKRDELKKYLAENNIATGLHYPIPLHLQPCFKYLHYKKGYFPITEKLAEQGLSLPIYPELTNEQIEYIADKIHHFFGK